MHEIAFTRDGLTLAGNLFTPSDIDESSHYPGAIVQGSFTSVKEQTAGTYARKLADQGFVTLAFDYTHYGRSEGSGLVLAGLSLQRSDDPHVFVDSFGGEDRLVVDYLSDELWTASPTMTATSWSARASSTGCADRSPTPSPAGTTGHGGWPLSCSSRSTRSRRTPAASSASWQ